MKLTEKIINVVTGEESFVERDATETELAEFVKAETRAQELAQLESEGAAKKAAAEAKLAALGLTTDDLKALGLN